MAYRHRALVKEKINDFHGAAEDYTKLIELNFEVEYAYFDRGLAKMKIGQTDSGCLDLSKAAELGNSYAIERIQQYCK